MDNDSSFIPLKRCTGCSNEFPATKQFFYAHSQSKDGLMPRCKTCWYTLRKPRQKSPEGQKQCSTCKGLFPATPEFFFKDKTRKDGFTPQCKACMKKYQQEHKEDIAKYKKNLYETNKAELSIQLKQYRQEHKEQMREYFKNRFRGPLGDEIRKRNREYQRSPRGRMVDRAAHHKRRIIRQNVGIAFTAQDIADQYKRQRGCCYYCKTKFSKGQRAYHADHIVPLSRGGSNGPENMVLACPTCNLRKHNKLPHEWPEGGRLL